MNKLPFNFTTKQFAGIIAVLLLGCIIACNSGNVETVTIEGSADTPTSSNFELSQTQFQSSEMKLGTLEKTTFHEVVKSTGMLDVPPEYRASVSAYFGGTVKNLSLIPGVWVKKGQVLFVLENPQYVQTQQEYLEAKGKLAYLKSDYDRQKYLVQDNVTSQKNYLKAESDYTVTRVQMESLAKKLSLMNIDPNTLNLENLQTTMAILSPISGYVNEVHISKGSFLNPSQEALTIVSTDHLHLELNVFEKDVANIRIGQAIKFRVQNNDRTEYSASVHLINKVIDEEKRSIGIHGHLEDERLSSRLNPGMYVEADIYTDSESKPSLPNDALVELDGKYYVLALLNQGNEGYTFERKEVQPGLSNNMYTEILNHQDFSDKTQFLTQGAFNLITE